MFNHFKIYEYGEPVKGTIFIFGAWRIPRLIYRAGIKKINRSGYKCVVLIPNPKLLTIGTPHSEIVDAAKDAVNYAASYIREHDKELKYMTMGVSLGTVFATEVAKKCGRIHSLILLAPFGDFGEHMKQWESHYYFGKLARSQPTALAESVAILNEVSTLNNIGALENKSVLVGYGTGDTLIYTKLIEDFIAKLKAENVNVITDITSGNHFISMYKISLRFRPDKLDMFQ